MGLLKKKKPEEGAPQALKAKRGGRPLAQYFLPIVLVAVLAMLGVAAFALLQMSRSAADDAARAARIIAESLSGQLGEVVRSRNDLVALALRDPSIGDALATKDADRIARLEESLQSDIPGAIQIRLLTQDVNQPDPSGAAPMGYAGLDMVRRTAETGRPSAAEVHQIKSNLPYVATAAPVSSDGKIVGVFFAGWDMRLWTRLVEDSPSFDGRLQLQQGDEGFVVVQGPGGHRGVLDDGSVDVAGSIWRIGYDSVPAGGRIARFGLMLGLASAAGIAILLVGYLQWRSLGGDLRADMGVLVALGEAILGRGGVSSGKPRVAGSADAIALLTQYASQARHEGVQHTAAESHAPTEGPPVANAPAGLDVEEVDEDPAELLTGGEEAVASAEPRAPTLAVGDIPASVFRAYDIRGVVGEVLTVKFAEALGRALGTLIQEEGGHKAAVGSDVRESSEGLADALNRGLAATGCDVLDLGQVPTPLVYFAQQTQPVQAGIMVTGSHNPPEYNGFKIVLGDRVVDGQALQDLRQRMIDGAFKQGNGSIDRVDVIGEYLEAITAEVQLARPLKVVVDAGNGVAGDLAISAFEALGCEVVPLFCDPDGSFPNHHPDPSQPDNLASLRLEVEAQEADLGIAFDGDGDRLGILDSAGNNVWPDRLLMLLAADVLGRHPGVDILYDVKSSRHLASFVLSHGGRPIMWQSGHSRMRAKMLETGALLGGEFTGHLFIKERWYGFDDAVYAAARIVEIVALESRPSSEVFAEIPQSPATPEYRLMLDEGQSRELMLAVDAHKVFEDARLVELDGVRVEFANGWGLIRSSNTTPSLTFRFEADDEGALEQIKGRFRELLQRVAPDLSAPF